MEEKLNKIKEFFKGINLEEETHKYTLNTGEILSPSVSGLLKDFYEPFNADVQSIYSAKKEGVSRKEILKKWKNIGEEAANAGTIVHNFGEDYFYNRKLIPNSAKEQGIVNFYNSLPKHIIPVLPELKMWHKKYKFAGTTDIPLYNRKTNSFIIGDYKTNKDLFKNYKGKTMINGFDSLLDTPLNHYKLQLSFYQIMLEQVNDIKVSKRVIIWLLPSGNFQLFFTEDYTKKLKKYLIDKYENTTINRQDSNIVFPWSSN